ncbi:hypothetical protein FB565_007690 [Actinoplanes lutulentus]|uniref:Glycerophosphoryl diester phosphodiesterase family protein n=1 Tax=Actinoplanes lutulentus TaxID=1287878 RepID=A0A327ZFS8_9ACTN|nr:hypothetical protein [Actinoplanes lutulentus]MBB2947919.1 hypothetical protein [Actinoplanes lutulentus]RAK40200.1 hypothetical protein B0I29_103230 [Actinoplanes lutulentus]
MNHGWENLDGNGHYWPSQTPGVPSSFHAGPSDPLVSPDFSGWCARGTALVKLIWKPALLLHVIVAVPTLVISLPAQNLLEREQSTFTIALDARPTGFPPVGDLAVAVLVVLLAALFTGALYLIATSATVQLVIQAATGRPVELGNALKVALRRTPALFGWGVLAMLLSVVAVLFCILPVIYVAAVLAVLPVVVTVERGAGIGRCFQLFHADFGVSAGRVATVYGIALGASFALLVVSTLAHAGLGATAGSATEVILNGLFSVAFGVVGTTFLVTTYADMRSRKEPFSTAYLTAP